MKLYAGIDLHSNNCVINLQNRGQTTINTILASIDAIAITNNGRLGIEADADASSRACSAENLSNNSNTINLWVFCFFIKSLIKPLIKRPLDI